MLRFFHLLLRVLSNGLSYRLLAGHLSSHYGVMFGANVPRPREVLGRHCATGRIILHDAGKDSK